MSTSLPTAASHRLPHVLLSGVLALVFAPLTMWGQASPVTQNFDNTGPTPGELTFIQVSSVLTNGGTAGYFTTAGATGTGAYGVSNVSGAPTATNNFVTLDFAKKTFAAGSLNNQVSFELASINNGGGNSSKGINNSTQIQVFLNINNTGYPVAGATTFPATPQFIITGDVNNGPNFPFGNGFSFSTPVTANSSPGTSTTVTYTIIKSLSATYASLYTLTLPNAVSGGTSMAMRIVLSSSGNTTILLDNVQYTSGNASPLPVELSRFEATAKAQGVAVGWATASEKNSASFDVQRSASGDAFETIGTVKAQGTSTSAHEYAFVDGRPLAGLAYYRLRQVDADGASVFSPVAAVAASLPATGLYPNPSTGVVTLPATLGDVQYRIYNVLGQTLLRGQAAGNDRLDVAALPKGPFFLELTGAAGRTTQRLLRE